MISKWLKQVVASVLAEAQVAEWAAAGEEWAGLKPPAPVEAVFVPPAVTK